MTVYLLSESGMVHKPDNLPGEPATPLCRNKPLKNAKEVTKIIGKRKCRWCFGKQ